MLIGLLIFVFVVCFFFINNSNDTANTIEQVKPIKEQPAWEREREKAERERKRAAKERAEKLRKTEQGKKWCKWIEREEELQKKRKQITTQVEWEARKRTLLSLNESTYKKLSQGTAYDVLIQDAKSEVNRIYELFSEASHECSAAFDSGFFSWKSALAQAEAKRDQIKRQLEDAEEHVEDLKNARRTAYDCIDITSDEIQGLILDSFEGRYQRTESDIKESNSYLTYLSMEEKVFYNEVFHHRRTHWDGLTGAFEQLKKDGLIIDTRIFPRDSQEPPTYQLTEQVPTDDRTQYALYISMADVDKMDGHKFEQFCADLLSRAGFYKVEVTKGSGDQGVDIIAVQMGTRYAIQCKRYSSSIGNKPVQEVYAGKDMYNCEIGVVLTNQYFTAGAKELAERTGVLLWNRDELERLIKIANS